MRLLLTRPADEAERTAAALRARGHTALLAPVLRIEPIDHADFGRGPWGGILVTSANAVRALERHPRRVELLSLPVLAVGPRTADAARAAGFYQTVSADGDGEDLGRLAGTRLGGVRLPLLYLAGSDRARDLAGDLGRRGIAVETVIVYRALAAATLPGAVRDALAAHALDGVMHYSKRSAVILLDCAAACGLAANILLLAQYCLSPRVAEPLAAAGAADIRIAKRPEEAALLDLLGASEGRSGSD